MVGDSVVDARAQSVTEPNRPKFADAGLLRKIARYAPVGIFAVGIFLALRPKQRNRNLSGSHARNASSPQ